MGITREKGKGSRECDRAIHFPQTLSGKDALDENQDGTPIDAER